MSQRLISLTSYFFKSVAASLAGILYLLLALVFYFIFFDPRQRTPDFEYYVLVIGLFGAVLAFLVTLTVAARANNAVYFPFLVRLPSRVEYLASSLISAFIFSALLQTLVAALALMANGPDIPLSNLLIILPLWTSVNLLFIALALHATDLVAAGWSRVYIFGILAILLYLQSLMGPLTEWLSGILARFSIFLFNLGVTGISTLIGDISTWLIDSGGGILSIFAGILFWPFKAIADAALTGYFNQLQALAPAILLLYATVLFLLAADFFATKDLFLSE
ncbi:MAG: hypothetical protein BMS9Abin02_1486 [Anaerolineae bacterium]|nr:MAG: hypothetical protein BMS9Abin02_1486 [Anaerolineae bacterium]